MGRSAADGGFFFRGIFISNLDIWRIVKVFLVTIVTTYSTIIMSLFVHEARICRVIHPVKLSLTELFSVAPAVSLFGAVAENWRYMAHICEGSPDLARVCTIVCCS